MLVIIFLKKGAKMDIVQVITQLGFPAGIALLAMVIVYKHEEFLQTTLKDMIKENTRALEELKVAISKITKGGGHEGGTGED